jgi:hypothetical protein
MKERKKIGYLQYHEQGPLVFREPACWVEGAAGWPLTSSLLWRRCPGGMQLRVVVAAANAAFIDGRVRLFGPG